MASADAVPAPGPTDGAPASTVDLLAACPAFTGVDHAALVDLAGRARPGRLTTIAVPQAPAVIVVRGGLVVRDGQGRSVDLVAQGEFSAPGAGERLEPIETADVLWLPESALDLAWSAPTGDLAARLVLADRPVERTVDLQTAAVRTVMSSPVRTAAPGETAREVARRMSEHRISSVVVVHGDRLGILTDRDLRSRLVASGRSVDTPIEELATFDVCTTTEDTPVFEALIEMLSAGVHHLPVVAAHGVDAGRVVGMLSSNDLLQLGTRSPLHLRAALDRATDVDAVAAARGELPDAVAALLAAGTTGGDVGRVIATVTDRVQRRLLGLALAELGEAPTAFGWIAFGSQGRREQTLHSDQDHGLLLPDDAAGPGGVLHPDVDAWWKRLAQWMVEALVACGYPRCDGGVMAVNDPWRRTASGWRSGFSSWIARPGPEQLLESSIAFDLRTVAGGLGVRDLLQPTIATAADRPVFLAQLARSVVGHRPPLGFLGRFTVQRSGQHQGALDIKAGAMLPIADLARLFTLARGGTEVATDARLAAAIADRQVSADLGATLRTGYELATGLRLRHHLATHRAGRPPDNWLAPDDLEPLVRSQLRETFKAIRTAQATLESRYRTGMLG